LMKVSLVTCSTFVRTSSFKFKWGLVLAYSMGQFKGWFLNNFHCFWGFSCLTKFSKECHAVPIDSFIFSKCSSTWTQ
jgi:hypothetical protein